MADNIGNKAAHDYHLDIAPVQDGFYVKGAAHCDWGMKNRLAKIFQPKSGNTVMLAFDHGYIMGPTAGLERIDLVVPPLAPYVDVLMGTKGVIRSCVSPASPTATCVRVTYDTTVLFDEMSNGGGIAIGILRYKLDGKWYYIAVGQGFARVVGNTVTMVVDSAERPEDVDAKRAQEAKERAEERIALQTSRKEYYRGQMAMARAMTRLKIKEKKFM